jgi:hypothetical protein
VSRRLSRHRLPGAPHQLLPARMGAREAPPKIQTRRSRSGNGGRMHRQPLHPTLSPNGPMAGPRPSASLGPTR